MAPITSLQMDNHEPVALINLIEQSVPSMVTDLNNRGYADFLWQSPDGPKQLERKTWSDLISSLTSIENQLMRQLHAHEDTKLILLVEGIVVPSDSLLGGTASLYQTKGKRNLYYEGSKSKVSMQALFAWLYQVSKHLEVFQTPTLEATAKAIVAFYSSDQKPEHATFTRHLKEVTFHPNPQVTSLMGMVPGLGPIKCEALIARFSTVWRVLTASPAELASVKGIGPNEAAKWLSRIGRPDV